MHEASDVLQFTHVAAYQFHNLTGLEHLKESIKQVAQQAELKGTVLLAPEGINLFLSGSRSACEGFIHYLQGIGFTALEVKYSQAPSQGFHKLKVKIKREIIRMNLQQFSPASGQRAQAISAAKLKAWLDQGRDDQGRELLMLDTRNDFEVDMGAFDNAMDWRLKQFSDFPQSLALHADAMKDKTVVAYCTGGIRCEKAVLLMQSLGIKNSYQLDGGILRYFEEVGGTHWKGECFVFDDRVALNPELKARTAATNR